MARKPKLVTITQTSNGLGTVTPAKELIAEAHAAGAVTVLDGAQSVPHSKVDVRDLEADFLAFSRHKMLAPPGSGVVWARTAILEKMRPFLYGGDMISRVAVDLTTWNDLPWKFEAGAPADVDAIGVRAAGGHPPAGGAREDPPHPPPPLAHNPPQPRAAPR